MNSSPRFTLFLLVLSLACGSEGGSSDEPTRKRVFVTSQLFTGALGGLAGADDSCQDLAIAAGRSGSYRAWLSDSMESPSTTFTRSSVPYVLVDGTRIADDWTDLTTNDLTNPIDLDENGDPAPRTSTLCGIANVWVHTATRGDGTPNAIGDNCSDWRSKFGGGTWGRYKQVSNLWTLGCIGGDLLDDCSRLAALYCFEQ